MKRMAQQRHILGSPVLLAVSIMLVVSVCCSRSRDSSREETAAFIDYRLPIGAFPNGQDRQEFVVERDSLRIRVLPSARPGSAYICLAVENSGRDSTWLEPTQTKFLVTPEVPASKVIVLDAKGQCEETGLMRDREEIQPAMERYFIVRPRWDGITIPKERSKAKLQLVFVAQNGQDFPIDILFTLGPSPWVDRR